MQDFPAYEGWTAFGSMRVLNFRLKLGGPKREWRRRDNAPPFVLAAWGGGSEDAR